MFPLAPLWSWRTERRSTTGRQLCGPAVSQSPESHQTIVTRVFRLQMAHASLGGNPTVQKNSSRRWAEPTSLSARWLVDDCFMTHYCPPLCEILAFYPAFKWRGNHHTLLQLRRSSILRAGATRRGFSLAGCPGWLLERRRGARFT